MSQALDKNHMLNAALRNYNFNRKDPRFETKLEGHRIIISGQFGDIIIDVCNINDNGIGVYLAGSKRMIIKLAANDFIYIKGE